MSLQESAGLFVLVALVVSFFGTVIIMFYRVYLKGIPDQVKDISKPVRIRVSKKNHQLINKVLSETNFYYINLNQQEKRKFVNRVMYFIQSKKWIGINGFNITSAVKIKVAATAVMITFGLNRFSLAKFRQIIISPDSYFLEEEQKYAKGHVHSKGFIFLAWNHFEDGYMDLNDGINLGIHEMAHALDFSGILLQNRMYYLQNLWSIYQSDMKNSGIDPDSKETLLRCYSKKDIIEFFAVAIESFFETPKVMRQKSPQLYITLKRLLNQDPAALLFQNNNEYKTVKTDITHEPIVVKTSTQAQIPESIGETLLAKPSFYVMLMNNPSNFFVLLSVLMVMGNPMLTLAMVSGSFYNHLMVFIKNYKQIEIDSNNLAIGKVRIENKYITKITFNTYFFTKMQVFYEEFGKKKRKSILLPFSKLNITKIQKRLMKQGILLVNK